MQADLACVEGGGSPIWLTCVWVCVQADLAGGEGGGPGGSPIWMTCVCAG